MAGDAMLPLGRRPEELELPRSVAKVIDAPAVCWCCRWPFQPDIAGCCRNCGADAPEHSSKPEELQC